MKITNIFVISAASLAALSFAACDDDNMLGRTYCNVSVMVNFPDGVNSDKISNPVVSFENVNTGIVKEFKINNQSDSFELAPGLYNVTYQADCHLEGGAKSVVKASSQSVRIDEASSSVVLDAFNVAANDDFVIAEIFFAGTLQSSGNQYYGDDYVKLYNNTDHVLYADGITFFESKFLTTQKFEYSPDIRHEAMTVQAVYTVPGSGHDHPVQPGEYFLLADTGIDHRVINPNSFDLSRADFEWYDVSTQPAHLDIDSPTVDNLDKWYCYTLSFFLLHNRGFRAYGIARIPLEKEEYLKNYRYSYDYTIIVEAGTFPMSQTAYKMPNKWILDAVNCSVQAEYQWNVSDPSLDMGWTYCGNIDHDKTRYFHSVRRKMSGLNPDGSPILLDTNNSSVDFNPFCIPSEIELQGTAMDIFGTPCSSITYDGVTPMPADIANRYRR
ncbi:MAG: DUF4876 domain-containing protein [Muribaculum sp.]|nr:DUF4876 domain-containing protein [Muribaculum sp.]